MTPKEYVELYHELRFTHPLTNVQVMPEVTEYGSGWETTYKDAAKTIVANKCNRTAIGPKARTEFVEGLGRALRYLHHGNSNTECGKTFSFKQRPVKNIDADEVFYAAGLTRAFVGKGSPYEIIDALRLALITGRIGAGMDSRGKPSSQLVLPAYVKSFFTLDCNALVSNYLGINPDTHIREYTKTGRRRMRVADIRAGDPLVTHGANPHEHIAIVNDIQPSGANEAVVEICEWGKEGGFKEHCKFLNEGRPIRIGMGTAEGFGLACDVTDDRARYFFAPPTNASSPRFYGLNGDESL